jgi:hypothetical protein
MPSQYCIGNTSCYSDYHMKQEILMGRVCSGTYINLRAVRFNNIFTLHLYLNTYNWTFYEFLIHYLFKIFIYFDAQQTE